MATEQITRPNDTAFSNDQYSLTKRELFAAMAMQGMCADPANNQINKQIAVWSVEMADSLIEELNKCEKNIPT